MNINGEPVFVGRDFGGRTLTIDAALVADYSNALGDFHPLYERFAPALILHSECYQNLNWYLRNIYGNLHARQEWELFRSLRVGSQVTTRGFIRERYHKRGRDYVVKETWVLDDAGRLVNRGITHQSFLSGDVDAKSGMVVDKGREKSPTRSFEVADAEGPLLDPIHKTVTEEMCMAFSGPGENYHTNKEAALALGFPDIVVQGMMPICFVSELLTREFGEGWLASGKMDVRLVNVLWGSESVRAQARVREEVGEADRIRVALDVWVEKDDGTKVVIGGASALR